MTEETKSTDQECSNAESFSATPSASTDLATDSDNPDEESDSNNESSDPEYHIEKLPTRLQISKTRGIAYYLTQAAKMLRMHEHIEVEGSGINIQIAVSLVLALEKQKIATVNLINTGMDIKSLLSQQTHGSMTTRPVSMMRFALSRGEFGQFISGRKQERMTEIFERFDESVCGYLSVDTIHSLDLGSKFIASANQRRRAVAFLEEFERNNKKLDLPKFIEYVSILIHPLLKEDIFKSAIAAIMK